MANDSRARCWPGRMESFEARPEDIDGLYNACMAGDDVLVILALNANPDVVLTATDGLGRTPLLVAARSGKDDIVRLLLAAGMLSNASADVSLISALHLAAEAGHADVTKTLLAAGANVDAYDRWGRTPLSYALKPISRSSYDPAPTTVDLLIAWGASIGAVKKRKSLRNVPTTAVLTSEQRLPAVKELGDDLVEIRRRCCPLPVGPGMAGASSDPAMRSTTPEAGSSSLSTVSITGPLQRDQLVDVAWVPADTFSSAPGSQPQPRRPMNGAPCLSQHISSSASANDSQIVAMDRPAESADDAATVEGAASTRTVGSRQRLRRPRHHRRSSATASDASSNGLPVEDGSSTATLGSRWYHCLMRRRATSSAAASIAPTEDILVVPDRASTSMAGRWRARRTRRPWRSSVAVSVASSNEMASTGVPPSESAANPRLPTQRPPLEGPADLPDPAEAHRCSLERARARFIAHPESATVDAVTEAVTGGQVVDLHTLTIAHGLLKLAAQVNDLAPLTDHTLHEHLYMSVYFAVVRRLDPTEVPIAAAVVRDARAARFLDTADAMRLLSFLSYDVAVQADLAALARRLGRVESDQDTLFGAAQRLLDNVRDLRAALEAAEQQRKRVAVATAAVPGWKQRAFAATSVSSLAWIMGATLWWRRQLPNGWGPRPTASLPVAAATSSAVIASRFISARNNSEGTES